MYLCLVRMFNERQDILDIVISKSYAEFFLTIVVNIEQEGRMTIMMTISA